jgi:hypothetical protein
MKNTNTLLETARALITSTKLDENIDHIKSLVSTVKVGDSTTFGKVLEIGANSITFKAKDLPKTTIPFNARKMGSSDYVLSSLLKLKENKLEEAYSIKTSAVRTLMAEFTSLDAVELEDFFKAAQAYFAKEGDEFDNDDFNDLSIIMDKAAKRWHNRATN